MVARSLFSAGIGLITLILANVLSLNNAFLSPKAFVGKKVVSKPSITFSTTNMRYHQLQSSSSLKLIPIEPYSSLLLSDETTASLELLRTVFVGIGAIVVFLIAFTYFTAAFIIPKAAQSLEEDTKRLRPEWWEEYEAKLGEGETMAQRPDLLQELGNKMKPVIMADFEREAMEKDKAAGSTSTTSMPSKPSSREDQWND